MFSLPPPVPKKKYYVVTGDFGHPDEWYLFNVGTETEITVRQWTSNHKRAIHFRSENEAEQVGELVLHADEFTVESFTIFP